MTPVPAMIISTLHVCTSSPGKFMISGLTVSSNDDRSEIVDGSEIRCVDTSAKGVQGIVTGRPCMSRCMSLLDKSASGY